MALTLKARRLAEEGAATIEAAIMMIVMVPLLLFVLFTSDAVYDLLEVQETVVSTIWDFSQAPWGSNTRAGRGAATGRGLAQRISDFNRLQYADHDSSFTNESQINSNLNSQGHHTQAFGQLSWCGSGGCGVDDPIGGYNNNRSSQVNCRIVQGGRADTFMMDDALGGSGSLRRDFSEGGVAVCAAKGWLLNYLIGQGFLEEFNRGGPRLFNKSLRSGSVQNAAGGAQASTDILLRARAALLVDTWNADADHADRNPSRHVDVKLQDDIFNMFGRESAFYNRTQTVFRSPVWYIIAVGGVGAYAGQAMSRNLAAVPAIPWGPASLAGLANPLGLWMVAKYDHVGNDMNKYKDKPMLDIFGKRLFTTPLYDGYQQAWQRRGNFYLGSNRQEGR